MSTWLNHVTSAYYHALISEWISKVECDNHCNGCEFVGELGQHVTSAYYHALTSAWISKIKIISVCRKDMEKHIMECPKRPYECPHCKETGDYQERTTKHLQVFKDGRCLKDAQRKPCTVTFPSTGRNAHEN